MVVGLQELRTDFGTYEQFVGRLCNVIKSSNVRRSLWNGTLYYKSNGPSTDETTIPTFFSFNMYSCIINIVPHLTALKGFRPIICHVSMQHTN